MVNLKTLNLLNETSDSQFMRRKWSIVINQSNADASVKQ